MATRRQTGARSANSKLAPKPKAGQPVTVVSAQKTTERVWNLSDWPGKGSAGGVQMLCGKNVAPGKAVRVPLGMLEKAKRLKALEKTGLIHIGATPPREYLDAKNRAKAVIPPSHARSHGHPVQKRAVVDTRKAAVKAAEVVKKDEEAVAEAKAVLKGNPKSEAGIKELARTEEVLKRSKAVAATAGEALAKARTALAELTPKAAKPAKKGKPGDKEPPAATVKLSDSVGVTDSVKATASGGGKSGKNKGK